MLTFSTLITLLLTILYSAALFFFGKVLSDSEQLRSFLGVKSKGENSGDFSNTTDYVEKIGNILMIIAVIGAFYSVITTLLLFA
ncbi:hypothetical protein [uncultured Kordia sp.]|uniref:hypothetical protein n=1 Tax=uncultured Kordia sp. TaxID=507699 RepID=UPI00261DF14C|nr:hypothetical protein [uncultured Kordia sp.]